MKAEKNHDRAAESCAISVSMSKEFRDRLKAAAKADNRNVSNFITHYLTQILDIQDEEVYAHPLQEQSEREAAEMDAKHIVPGEKVLKATKKKLQKRNPAKMPVRHIQA